MTTVLLAALTLILIVLFFALSRKQQAQVLKFLLWAGIIVAVPCVAVGELIWFRRDYETARDANLLILIVLGGAAAIYGVPWFFRHYWWSWPPSNWKLALLLRKIHRECAPPMQFLTAKTVFIEDKDRNTDMEGTAYRELEKWGRFEVVSERAKADLILSLSMIRPGAQFGAWVQARPELAEAMWKEGLERSDEVAKVKIPYGCACLEVTDLKQKDILGSRFVTLWQSHPRSATRDLMRQLRKTIREAEKWYERK